MAEDKAAALRRRFYKSVGVEDADEGFLIVLDARPVKTPGKASVVTASRPLAEAIAAEWEAQGEKIDPHSMPLTQIACTAIDKVVPNRDEIVAQVVRYAGADLLCYRVDNPADLVARQLEEWQPVLDWLASAKGVSLRTTTGLIAEDQDPAAMERAAALVEALDDHELAAMAVMVQTTGSFALTMAVINGYLNWERAADASQLDETYQSELWGSDREAEQRLRGLRNDIEAASRYLTLHRK